MLRPALLVCLLLPPCFSQSTTGWQLVWSDEFSGPANSAPDQSKWAYDTGKTGWGNNELETYTQSTSNSYQDGHGHLVIQALSSGSGYTSARLKTQGKFTFTYGRFEARVKLPYAKGIWPAFWLLGANAQWPTGGEIDIMENFGANRNDASLNRGTIHGPNYAGAGVGAKYAFPADQSVSSDFHVYAINWQPGRIEFFVDNHSYFVATPASLPAGGRWVFDNNPMYILLNVAVGGNATGSPDGTQFPQQMIVDYVRLYQRRA